MADTPDNGSWNLPYPEGSCLLAPLAGIGDIGFRTLCLEQGASFTFTEMISAKALSYDSGISWEMVKPAVGEQRFGVQLFGHEPQIMADMASQVVERFEDQVALIDINMGCPVTKVIKKGEGAGLMETPRLAADIVRTMVKQVDIPITAKMRRGFSGEYNDAVDLAMRLEDAGISAVCVHGRTASQMYHGASNWETIAEVKEAVSIPVIGNGDLVSQEAIQLMFETTGADCAMVARGALGNPWIFSGHVPTYDERIDCALRHVGMLYEESGIHGFRRFRKHAPHYLLGMPHASTFRNACMKAQTLDELTEVFETLRSGLDDLGVLHDPAPVKK